MEEPQPNRARIERRCLTQQKLISILHVDYSQRLIQSFSSMDASANYDPTRIQISDMIQVTTHQLALSTSDSDCQA
ncbi:hypothetical protein BYT27DRAFT_7196535 [Phlegmacium glaucopus]|nr:hypothetical protein BYT27DRAFT_7196535 [Phlegmacium glaucopus]